MKIIDKKEFEETIKEGVTLVDFFATWCGNSAPRTNNAASWIPIVMRLPASAAAVAASERTRRLPQAAQPSASSITAQQASAIFFGAEAAWRRQLSRISARSGVSFGSE